jgi:hypothetical protein
LKQILTFTCISKVGQIYRAPSGNLTGLEHVREVNLANLARMPDFIAEEHVIRSFIPAGSTKASSQDIFASDIIGFGSELHAIFDKSCETRFDFAGQEEAAGGVLVYLFKSPPDGCFGPDQSGPAGFSGQPHPHPLAEGLCGVPGDCVHGQPIAPKVTAVGAHHLFVRGLRHECLADPKASGQCYRMSRQFVTQAFVCVYTTTPLDNRT